MEFAAKNLTMGQMNAIVKKLGGEEGALRFLASTVEVVFQTLLSLVVRVDRTQTAVQAIEATGRKKWYIDEVVLAEMPLEGRAEEKVEFFELDYDPTVDELDREYEARSLRPDPLATAQAMADDPAFADERPVAVQWRDKRGRACCAIFGRDGVERGVDVGWNDDGWDRDYRFAGVRK